MSAPRPPPGSKLTSLPESSRPWQRTLRGLVAAVMITAGLASLVIVPQWIFASALPEQDFRRSLAITFLDALLLAYGLAVAAAIVATVALALRIWPGKTSWNVVFRSAKERTFAERKATVVSSQVRKRWASRVLRLPASACGRAWGRLSLVCISLWLSLALLEAGAWAWTTWLDRSRRLPDVGPGAGNPAATGDQKSAPPSPEHPRLPTQFQGQAAASGASDPLRILVIGESSARGEPYHPVVSVGQIVAWRLEDVFPDRPVEVDMCAAGGATLEMMHNKLAGLSYRPDVLLVYVGHNEFAARCPWMRQFDYYLDDRPQLAVAAGMAWVAAIARFSPLCRLALATRDRHQVGIKPGRVVTRELIDRPAYTNEEAETIRSDFQRRLETIAAYCERIGTVPVFVIPPCNDSGFDPNRSVLAPEVPRAKRVAFARSVARARALEAKEPALAMQLECELVERHPDFAELHFRLARMLEQAGRWDEARVHYIQARELDRMPLRCPEPLRQAYRQVAAAHPSVLLVDGPRVFEAKSAHGIVGDQFFHDAQHPNLRGYAILAEEVLHQLAERSAFGWPEAKPAPPVDTEACARHFRITAARWEEVCRREAWFFDTTAYIRYDPRFRTERARAYHRGAAAIQSGCDPAAAQVPGWPLPPRPAPSQRMASKGAVK